MLVYVLLKDGASANPPRPVAVEIARSSADDAFAPASVADEGTDLLDIIGGADTQLIPSFPDSCKCIVMHLSSGMSMLLCLKSNNSDLSSCLNDDISHVSCR